MDELISRKAAIDALGEEPMVWSGKDEYEQGLNNQWRYDLNAIKAVAAAQPKRFYVIDTKDGMCRLCDWKYLEELASNEEWAKDLCHFDMEQFAIGEDGSLYLLDECGKWVYPPEGRFEVKWMT